MTIINIYVDEEKPIPVEVVEESINDNRTSD